MVKKYHNFFILLPDSTHSIVSSYPLRLFSDKNR